MEKHLEILRQSTLWFIDQDPTVITLVRRVPQKTNTGAFSPGPEEPQPSQTVKLIGSGETGISEGDGGDDMSYDYTVVFPHDGNVQVGDYWRDSRSFWHVYAREADNGYEVKVKARQYSREASDE